MALEEKQQVLHKQTTYSRRAVARKISELIVMKRYKYYDGSKVFFVQFFDDGSYRISDTDDKLVELGDEMWLMSNWAKNILNELMIEKLTS